MTKSSGTLLPSTTRRPAGFALVVVLSLMVILVLLLLSLSQVLQTEIYSSTAEANIAQARSAALFGLNKAVGELQSLAGPDQRVTATADILQGGYSGLTPDPSKSHWTGVWNASTYDSHQPQTKEFLGWLVSSPSRLTALDAAQAPLAGETIQLVGEGAVGTDTTRQVSAPLIPIQDASGTTLGKFAFWVGDEGVKAKFDLPRPSASDTSSHRARYDFMASQRNAVETFGTGSVGGVFSEETALHTNAPKLLSRDHLQLLGSSATSMREKFHDFTLFSKGVLSDTAKGGLKRDLTWLLEAPESDASAKLSALDRNPASTGSQIVSDADWPAGTSLPPTWELLRSFYRLKDEPTPVATRKQTATEQGIMPVIACCYVFFRPGLRVSGSNSYFRLNLDTQIVLWNPYNVSLAGRAYDLEIALNSFKMFLQAGGIDRGTSYDMQGVTGVGFQPLGTGKCISFRIPAVDLGPGESRIFSIASSEHLKPYSGSNLLANQAPVIGIPNSVWMELPTPIPQAPPIANSRVRLQATANATTGLSTYCIHIGLKDEGTAGDSDQSKYWSKAGLWAGEGGNYNDPSERTLDNQAIVPWDTLTLQLHTALFSGNGYRNARWIANGNPRATLISRSAADLLNNPLYELHWRSKERTSYYLKTFPTSDIDGPLVRTMPYINQKYQLALFEIPTGARKCLSIADFQHVNVYPEGTSNAYLIGNSLADIRLGGGDTDAKNTSRPADGYAQVVDGSFLLNEVLWDGFFLSTVDSELTDTDLKSGKFLPNARMKPEGTTDSSELKDFEKAAAHMMLDGAFNINSTSVDAWKSILAGTRGLPFNPVTGGTASPSGITFSRLALPAGSENAPWLGYRELTDAQLQLLAEKIVEEVRTRGPFLSLADFVNRRLLPASDPTAVKGALARAIDQSNINSNTAQGLPTDATSANTGSNWQTYTKDWYLEQALLGSTNEGATNWIIQGDLLQAIGGMIAPRSDTFVVRSYGSALNPKGEVSAEAWCEAVVQRFPEPVEASATNEQEPKDQNFLGRQFRIVSFRWLNHNQL